MASLAHRGGLPKSEQNLKILRISYRSSRNLKNLKDERRGPRRHHALMRTPPREINARLLVTFMRISHKGEASQPRQGGLASGREILF